MPIISPPRYASTFVVLLSLPDGFHAGRDAARPLARSAQRAPAGRATHGRRADVQCNDPRHSQAAASTGSYGSRTVKQVPVPVSERTVIVPPCASTIAFEMTRPSPVPGIACWVAV